jgi:hypothetical protein
MNHPFSYTSVTAEHLSFQTARREKASDFARGILSA